MKIILILNNIRSVHNVGAVFRTADAVGVSKIYLTGYTPTPLDRFGRIRNDFHKAALGAELSVSWEQILDVEKLMNELRSMNYELVALEQDARAINYKSYKPKSDSIALIVGNEVAGVAKNILDMCDRIIEIPMRGKKESLNVSVVTGIALYTLVDS